MSNSILVSSLQGAYEVRFFDSLAQVQQDWGKASELFVVADKTVLSTYQESLKILLAGLPIYEVTADEEAKSLSGVHALSQWLAQQGATKSATLVGIGGGCIQDLASFTSHVYFRGIDWVYFPTTLLSQADSCIGAKSGINLLPLKNQLGAIHSPREVLVIKEFLSSLPNEQVMSGFGEIVKLSLTSSRHFFVDLERDFLKKGYQEIDLLGVIKRSLEAKKEIIEIDEYETDLRRILNYGHTFGHALEALNKHQIPHGLSVLWGIDLINSLGVNWGITSQEIRDRVRALIRTNFDYTLSSVPTANELIEMVSRDKKVKDGKIHFAILREIGEFAIEPMLISQELVRDVDEALREPLVFCGD